MEPVIVIIVLAAFGEVVIEVLKPLLDPLVNRLPIPQDVNAYLYLSCAFGLLLSYSFSVNILEVVGLDMPNAVAVYTGITATGLILGRGANFVHDAIARMGGGERQPAQ